MTGFWRIVLAVVVLALAVLVLAPAALLDAPLAAATARHLRLVDASGLWWRGQGALATNDGALRMPLRWRVALAPLVVGDLAVDLYPEGDAQSPSGALAIRKGAIAARDLHVAAPAAIASAFDPALALLALRGDLDLRAPSLVFEDRRASGSFDATWTRARIVAGPASVDLGRVVARGTPDGDGIGGVVRNEGGDVAVSGTFAAKADTVETSVDLSPRSSATEATRALLGMLGPADGTAHVRLHWQSRQR